MKNNAEISQIVFNNNDKADDLPIVVSEICERLYNEIGVSGVTEYANKIGLSYSYCKPCDADMPMIQFSTHKDCACCGTENEVTIK